MSDDLPYFLGLNAFWDIGPRRFGLLADYFGSAKNIWQAKKEELLETGLSPKLVNQFVAFRGGFDLDEYLKKVSDFGAKTVTIEDKNYPKNLKQIDDAPFLLYYKGEIKEEDSRALAVIGSRRMTTYGRQITEEMTRDLVSFGLTIVAGMARGVDSVAHWTAIKAGGRTLAVLGNGLDVIYPPENHRLYKKIIQKGAVISEFPLKTKPHRGNFPLRNRIISGLSRGVLITEGAKRSGTKITASWAAKQGREVFAAPGPVDNPLSQGPFDLIQKGAKLVSDVSDILEELDIKAKAPKHLRGGPPCPEPNVVLGRGLLGGEMTEEEKTLLEILQDGALHIDEIVRKSKMKTSQVASLLTKMEIKGRVKNLGKMTYALKR